MSFLLVCIFICLSGFSVSGLSTGLERCPPWIPRDQYLKVYGNKCYGFEVQQTKTFQDARDHCQLMGGNLVMAKSEKIKNFLIKELVHSYEMPMSAVWIGLTFMYFPKSQQYIALWEDGSKPKLSEYIQFYPKTGCGLLLPFFRMWVVRRCDSSHYSQPRHLFVCEYPLKEDTKTITSSPLSVTEVMTSSPILTSTSNPAITSIATTLTATPTVTISSTIPTTSTSIATTLTATPTVTISLTIPTTSTSMPTTLTATPTVTISSTIPTTSTSIPTTLTATPTVTIFSTIPTTSTSIPTTLTATPTVTISSTIPTTSTSIPTTLTATPTVTIFTTIPTTSTSIPTTLTATPTVTIFSTIPTTSTSIPTTLTATPTVTISSSIPTTSTSLPTASASTLVTSPPTKKSSLRSTRPVGTTGPPTRFERCPSKLPRDQYLKVFRNKCYRFEVLERRTFNDAQAHCERGNGNLAMIKTTGVRQFLINHLRNTYGQYIHQDRVWMGLLVRRRSWSSRKYIRTWVDGSNFNLGAFKYRRGGFRALFGRRFAISSQRYQNQPKRFFICEYLKRGAATSAQTAKQ